MNWPPPSVPAVLPLTVQLVSESVPAAPVYRPPPLLPAVLPLTVQADSDNVPYKLLNRPPPLPLAELPLIVQFVSESAPRLRYRPPPLTAWPPVIVIPDNAAEALSISNTPLAPPAV